MNRWGARRIGTGAQFVSTNRGSRPTNRRNQRLQTRKCILPFFIGKAHRNTLSHPAGFQPLESSRVLFGKEVLQMLLNKLRGHSEKFAELAAAVRLTCMAPNRL